MKKNNKKKVWFIVLVSIFSVLWVASIVFLGFATLSETITDAIESAYSSTFTDKTLNLLTVSMWGVVLSTIALVITLLAQEIKKKYLK
jgi:hypothetical protein